MKFPALYEVFQNLRPCCSPARKIPAGTSPVVQWLRICLLVQGTRVQSLAWDDPTCRRTPKPEGPRACGPQEKLLQ